MRQSIRKHNSSASVGYYHIVILPRLRERNNHKNIGIGHGCGIVSDSAHICETVRVPGGISSVSSACRRLIVHSHTDDKALKTAVSVRQETHNGGIKLTGRVILCSECVIRHRTVRIVSGICKSLNGIRCCQSEIHAYSGRNIEIHLTVDIG